VPSRIVWKAQRRILAGSALVLAMSGVAGCHKLRSQLAGTGDADASTPTAAADSGKVKHLHLGGGGGGKPRSLLAAPHAEAGEHSEAALARQTHHGQAPVFHWGGDGGGRQKSHSHF
jgi:hypothetical protein